MAEPRVGVFLGNTDRIGVGVAIGLGRRGDAVLGAGTTNSSVTFSFPLLDRDACVGAVFHCDPEASGVGSTSSSAFLFGREELALAGAAGLRGEGVIGRVEEVIARLARLALGGGTSSAIEESSKGSDIGSGDEEAFFALGGIVDGYENRGIDRTLGGGG
jgi:hypothetical protein